MSDSNTLGRVTRRTVEDEVYARIRHAILRGEIAGGERLVHDDLAGRFGTSRIPVRDALKRLLLDGLVSTDARRAYRVTVFGRADIEEIYELRELLETRAIRMAAARIDQETLAGLRELQAQIEDAADDGDRELYVELNQVFHSRIYAAADQPRLERIIHGLWQGLPPLAPIRLAQSLVEAAAEHRSLIDALAAGDGEAAGQALQAHIARVKIELCAQIDDRIDEQSDAGPQSATDIPQDSAG